MANNVQTYVRFVNINEEGKAKLKSLYDRIRTEGGDRWFADMWVAPGGDITYEETNSRSWYIENVGPKWCYFDDYEDDYFTTVSAWGYPEDGIAWVMQQLGKAQPNIVAEVRYQDEMPNFYGGAVFTCDGEFDGFEEDYDEMLEVLKTKVQGLAEEWNEEDQEWSDEGYDLLQDSMYDHMDEVQDEMLSTPLEHALEEMNSQVAA